MNLLTFPIGEIFNNVNDVKRICVDIVYILCMKHRPEPKTSPKELLKYARKVVLLFSDAPAEWINNYSDPRIIVELINDTDFYESFKKEHMNSFVKYRPNFDIPIKRNYALYDAKNKEAKYIWMLDDDIVVSKENYLQAISALQHGKAVVGFHVFQFPDVSSIDRIENIISNREFNISMTGSCMFLDLKKINGYFPFVYNEDLFFFMQQKEMNNVASGGTVEQEKNMQWMDVDRIKHEQFGDFIYNVFKKQFINHTTNKICWEHEKEKQLIKIKELTKNTSNEKLKEMLAVAEEAIEHISIKEVKLFIESCHFANWVCKYIK